MKNTNMIRFTRGAVLAGLVLGSSMAQAWGNRSIVLPKVMSKVAAKSFFSNHKLALGLGTAGVALTAGAIVFARYFKQTEDYKNSTGKKDCAINFGKYVGGKMKDGASYSWNKAKDATFATGRGLKAIARWTGFQLTFHKYCKPVAAPIAEAAEEPPVAAKAKPAAPAEAPKKDAQAEVPATAEKKQ